MQVFFMTALFIIIGVNLLEAHTFFLSFLSRAALIVHVADFKLRL